MATADADTGRSLEELMRLALSGDANAYTLLLKETAQLLRPYLVRHLREGSEVDDLMQEILISIHKARDTYDGERPYKPWAFAIAHYRLQDHLRRVYSDRLSQAVNIDDVENYLSQDVTETEFSYESISREIDKLSPKQADILRLLHKEGYTSSEVARELNMSVSAVKVAAHRAYKVLRERIDRGRE